jgi:Domain of unknown function (DUF4082)/Fibronectin type III domain
MKHSKGRTGPFVLKLGFVFLCLSFGKLAFSASVTLTWNPNSESDLAGYRIRYGPVPGVHPTSIDVGNQTTYTVSGLSPGTHYFVVLAYNTSGLQSPLSNEVSVTLTALPPPPTNPLLTASPSSVGPGGSVTVSWSGIANARVKDWIGQYPAAANDGGYTTWKYTSSCGQTPGGVALPSGSCTFVMPAVPGIYQFRLFADNTYTRLAASAPVAVGTTQTIWPSTAVPVRDDGGPDSPVELGVRFRSDVAGFVTGVRFYKAALNSGTHVGNLWTSTGIRLATATFTGESTSGWQQVNFSPPVAIAANTVYVASYHCPNGHYSLDLNYFSGKGVDSPPLHLLADGVAGGNGVFAYGATSSFPTNTWSSANYWVDLVFTASPPGGP